MSNIQIGDHVSWLERTPARPYLHTETGVVVGFREEIYGGHLRVLAVVEGENGRPMFCGMATLTKVGLVATGGSTFESLTDDYAQLKAIGDLGGAELS